jgi:hypothetical protein
VLLRAAALVPLALALAACGGSGSSTSTQGRSQLPIGCSTSQVQSVVEGWLTRPSPAPAGFFRTYSERESDGRVFRTASGPAAAAHQRQRLRLGERDRVLQIQVYPVDVNHVRIVVTLTRTAPDFAKRGIRNRIASGSGTVDCAHQKLAGLALQGP